MPGRAWYLETVAEGQLRRVLIAPLPFRVGRQRGLELVLSGDSVSKVHAEIYAAGADLRIRDLSSRNGTFVNRVLVEDAALAEGDVLHFADFEFRVGRSRQAAETVDAGVLTHRFEEGGELRELLRGERIAIVFQPIVQLASGDVVAHEALGRGRQPGLPEEPRELFRIAETIEAETELSRLLRRRAVELAGRRDDMPAVFLNTHPAEFTQPGLLQSLEELRAMAPRLDLALEIHESVLAQPPAIADLRTWLRARRIALAFDNFGAGQARLHELADAPPDYLKFSRRFVVDIDRPSPGKRRLLQSLLTFARHLGARTVAEGIETAAEARACAAMGFTYGQGTYLGRPRELTGH